MLCVWFFIETVEKLVINSISTSDVDQSIVNNLKVSDDCADKV